MVEYKKCDICENCKAGTFYNYEGYLLIFAIVSIILLVILVICLKK